MERPTRIQQLYGYTICLVAVIVLLVNISSLIDAMFDRSHPLDSPWAMRGPERLTSFEAYRASVRNMQPPRSADSTKARSDTLTEAQQRAQFNALRADAMESARNEIGKRMVRSVLLIVLGVLLFAFHWTWLRQYVGVSAGHGADDSMRPLS